MKAVVLKAPYQVKVEQVPYPTIQEAGDVIIKVSQAGLCGKQSRARPVQVDVMTERQYRVGPASLS